MMGKVFFSKRGYKNQTTLKFKKFRLKTFWFREFLFAHINDVKIVKEKKNKHVHSRTTRTLTTKQDIKNNCKE